MVGEDEALVGAGEDYGEESVHVGVGEESLVAVASGDLGLDGEREDKDIIKVPLLHTLFLLIYVQHSIVLLLAEYFTRFIQLPQMQIVIIKPTSLSFLINQHLSRYFKIILPALMLRA